MKYQIIFSRKNKKNIISLLSVTFFCSMLSVNFCHTVPNGQSVDKKQTSHVSCLMNARSVVVLL